ncbi:COX15/CtaA family protein [Sphaerisporangium siamense]|uniref:Cytochrome c oxidase assembly protein subunit 15 n=1 Tax=Sphaerisporangium siamense TaxID=795645 RepID=A0A7W7DCB4_9ACTN|nr:COX15/CtaA family protein [Sphaerisporangium siamense]MBB4703415.1 cytochrome c oxidase assembly protein subunit 15 [Sphaerisporangium siamense]
MTATEQETRVDGGRAGGVPGRLRSGALGLFHSVWSPTAVTMRRWALTAVVVNVGISVTGAAVRLTGSGLGCPSWPRCTPGSFVPAPHDDHSPLNMAIEFGNRLLSFLVLAVAVACLVAAFRRVPRRRPLVAIALIQPLGVAVQAVWGGIVVRTMLNPVTVSVHFLLSIGMIAAALALYARAGEGDAPPRRLVHRDIRTLGFVLVAAVFVLLVAGVVVTGTGPHSGDDAASRFSFDIEAMARLHADAVWVVLGLTFALLFALHVTDSPGRARRGALVLLGVELAQGVIGYVQYFLAVPALLVGLHVLGSTLVWIAALRVVFLMRSRGTEPSSAPPAAPGANEVSAAGV